MRLIVALFILSLAACAVIVANSHKPFELEISQ